MKKISKLMTLNSLDWEYLIDKWVLSARDRRILKRFLIDAWTIEKIAEKHKLSVSQTKRILNKWQSVIYRNVIK